MTTNILFKLHLAKSLSTAKKNIKKLIKQVEGLDENAEDFLTQVELLTGMPYIDFNYIYNTFPYSLQQIKPSSSSSDDEGDEDPEFHPALPKSLVDDFHTVYNACLEKVDDESQITPSKSNILRGAYDCLDNDIRLIVIGQDPYPTPGKATGRAFEIINSQNQEELSEKEFKKYYNNTSVQFIYDQLSDEGYPVKDKGNFDRFVEKGVMWLNTILTTTEGKMKDHKSLGWENWMVDFIDEILSSHSASASEDGGSVCLLLWGGAAFSFVKKFLKKKYKIKIKIDDFSYALNESAPKFKYKSISLPGDTRDLIIVTNCHPSPMNRKLMKTNWKGVPMFRFCEEIMGLERGELWG